MLKQKSKINNQRLSWISSLAEQLAIDHCTADTYVNPHKIANHYGITFSCGNYGPDSFDGLIEYENGKWHIYINEQKHSNVARHRFSFAHELGHYFIDEHANALSSGTVQAHPSYTELVSDNETEREADFFAACLLMPESLVRKDYSMERKFSFSFIKKLSVKYQVSQLAAIFRFFYLDLHPIVIVKSTAGKTNWVMRSSDIWTRLKTRKNASVPEESLAAEYFRFGRMRERTDQLWKGDWFDTSSENPIYEHCLYHDSLDQCYSVVWGN